jgi:hypothetical protein
MHDEADTDAADAPAGAPAWLGGERDVRPLAVLWATVDLDRALRDLGTHDRVPSGTVINAVDDPLLGARVVIVPAHPPENETLAIAEPSTEGRLAATLARRGEGPAGRYLAVPIGLDEIGVRAATAGVTISRPELGPFGRAVLVLGPAGGPHVIVVEPPAVPSRP